MRAPGVDTRVSPVTDGSARAGRPAMIGAPGRGTEPAWDVESPVSEPAGEMSAQRGQAVPTERSEGER